MNKLLEKTALANKGTRKEYKEEWEAFRFMIDDKMFAMVGENKEGESILTIKLAPDKGELLRKSYPQQVFPGYYMNKVHWNSFSLDNLVDKNIIVDGINESYNLILSGFSKKRQKEILEADNV